MTRSYTIVPSLPDHRDRGYLNAFAAPAAAKLPVRTVQKDQGQEGSCTGFALSSGFEALAAQHGDATTYSPAFVYYDERSIEHTTRSDSGAMISDGLKVLRTLGICPENEMPYVPGGYRKAPSRTAKHDATAHKIASYSKVPDLSALKAAIAGAQPVVLGIAVYESFEAVGADGVVPMPKASEELLGGHAILVIGYGKVYNSPGDTYLVLQNSWGAGFADGGLMYLPAAYFQNANDTFEAWTFSR